MSTGRPPHILPAATVPARCWDWLLQALRELPAGYVSFHGDVVLISGQRFVLERGEADSDTTQLALNLEAE